MADPAATRTRGTDSGSGRVVEWWGGGSRWGERRTSVGGVSRFLGVRAAAASAVEVRLGRGGAGLGRASRLNVLNGLRRRRLYACGTLSISPKTPRSRATGARERAHPKTNADQTFFLSSSPPHSRPPKAHRPRTTGFYVLLLLLPSLLSLFFFTINASHTHTHTQSCQVCRWIYTMRYNMRVYSIIIIYYILLLCQTVFINLICTTLYRMNTVRQIPRLWPIVFVAARSLFRVHCIRQSIIRMIAFPSGERMRYCEYQWGLASAARVLK